jgi:Holliday junction resolvase-like predicted endonuclease
LVIVEVKTRSCADAWPEERVDASKQRSLIRLARTLARRGNLSSPLRIDVIAINLSGDSPPCIRWFENAVMGS